MLPSWNQQFVLCPLDMFNQNPTKTSIKKNFLRPQPTATTAPHIEEQMTEQPSSGSTATSTFFFSTLKSNFCLEYVSRKPYQDVYQGEIFTTATANQDCSTSRSADNRVAKLPAALPSPLLPFQLFSLTLQSNLCFVTWIFFIKPLSWCLTRENNLCLLLSLSKRIEGN